MSAIVNHHQQTPRTALFDAYAPAPGVYDEVFTEQGSVRPHCQQFVTAMDEVGPDELTRRWERAERLVRDNGMVYNAYGDPAQKARPWDLDALPLLISADEWRSLSAALVQRARLLNLILSDLHGKQELLTRGLLPADLVFSHPGYNRAFHNQRVPGNVFLHFYAADLARAPDGKWWVAADRTDAPLGAGYALENRIVTSRMLPNVIHHCHVQRLASFFIALRETLHRLARSHRDNPRIVILSHGPHGPNYFEDAYLARYLGYTLVEGGDLTVRRNRVFMKTLGGLLQVDVILRRLSDQYSDPLELRGDASLGVAGLLNAVRAGHVVVANALGSSLVESPAFVPFFRGLSREVLGQELLMPSVATWWCGQAEPRDYVLSTLDQLNVRSAYRVARKESPRNEELSEQTPEQLAALIHHNPAKFVGQEHIVRSSAPIWSESTPSSSHVALRVFVVRTKNTYTVMPGGLVRVASSVGELDRSILAGEGSKDAWVLAAGPVKPVSLLEASGKGIELRRGGNELPSRVADNLFWLGRHIERAEGAARLLRPVLVRLTSESEADDMPEVAILLHTLAELGQIEPGFVVDGIKEQLPAIETGLPRAVLDDQQSGSLRATVAAMYRNASLVRDRLSLDSWRVVHRINQQMQTLARRRRVDLGDLLEMLNRLIIDLSAFGGMVSESMTRTQGWRFLDIGRRIERSLNTVSLVQAALMNSHEHDGAVLEAVLEMADSIMTYRSRYLANLQLPQVLDLLLTDESNPRSLAFQMERLSDHIEKLPRERTQPLRSADQRLITSALNSLRTIDLETLTETQTQGERSKLYKLLARLNKDLPKLSQLISHKYLVHAGTPRQLAAMDSPTN